MLCGVVSGPESIVYVLAYSGLFFLSCLKMASYWSGSRDGKDFSITLV